MQTIELQQLPSQTLNIVLAEQNLELKFYQKNNILYSDCKKEDVIIWAGVICLDRQNIKPFKYFDFQGALIFIDLYGEEDPTFDNFNSRFQLLYLTEEELNV